MKRRGERFRVDVYLGRSCNRLEVGERLKKLLGHESYRFHNGFARDATAIPLDNVLEAFTCSQ